MNIAKMHIIGYRRFSDGTITFCPNDTDEPDTAATVLVGANNSGKTSIVELIHAMLNRSIQQRMPYTFDDFNITMRNKWVENGRARILTYLQNNDPEKETLSDTIHPDDSDSPARRTTSDQSLIDQLIEVVAPTDRDHKGDTATGNPTPLRIEVQLTVDYTDNDDIRDLADYLMYFTETSRSVYFRYIIHPHAEFMRGEAHHHEMAAYAQRIKAAYASYRQDGQQPASRINSVIDDVLTSCFCKSLKESVFYCNNDFSEQIEIPSMQDFRKLFNCVIISARRDLDDTNNDHSHTLSSRLMDSVSAQAGWTDRMAQLQSELLQSMDNNNYKDMLSKGSQDALNDVIEKISQTNGGSDSIVGLRPQFDYDAIQRFVRDNTVAGFTAGEAALGEHSQGLGYSNLILILLDFLAFMDSCPTNTRKINFIIIEEPESHMHPQMQSVFIRHVFDKLKEAATPRPTCLVTTHSEQIVRESKLVQMRVLRPGDGHESRIIDLIPALEELNKSNNSIPKATPEQYEEQHRLYQKLFSISFADLVFADKAILFEGDTERMYLQALIRESSSTDYQNNNNYHFLQKLQKQYISYVQVGGSHAFWYVNLLKALNIRSVIITDLDYPKETETSKDIGKLTTSNPTINTLLLGINSQNDHASDDLCIQHIHDTLNHDPYVGRIYLVPKSSIAVTCQSDSDGYSRTLEEALLYALFRTNNDADNVGVVDIFEKKSANYWENEKRKAFGDQTLPYFPKIQNGHDYSLQDFSHTIANKHKTDFAYTLILLGRCIKAMPRYIEDSLRWLAENNATQKTNETSTSEEKS